MTVHPIFKSMLILAMVFVVSACSAVSTPTPTSSPMPTSTPTAIPATPTQLPSTVTPTATQPMPTAAFTVMPPTFVPPTETPAVGTDSLRVRVTFGDTVLTAVLADNPTTRDFISLLPLTLTLEDYGGTEKISFLPRTLTSAGAPTGYNPYIGDITYYAPWGNLAIFVRDYIYSDGLIYLGTFDGSIDALSVSDLIEVTIELEN